MPKKIVQAVSRPRIDYMPFVSAQPGTRAVFDPRGLVAVDADAIGREWSMHALAASPPLPSMDAFHLGPIASEVAMSDHVCVMDVFGPLVSHFDMAFNSYDRLRAVVGQAIASGAKSIVMRMDSPGGMAAGSIETARTIRKMVVDAGVDLIAYVDGRCASAAYAIATAARAIYVTPTALVGSIGAMEVVADTVEASTRAGRRAYLIKSGKYKGAGDPDNPVTDEIVAEIQSRIDQFAEHLFALCVDHGWGKSVDALRSLEGRVFFGTNAVDLGLATSIVSSAPLSASETTEKNEEENMDPEEIKQALQALVDGGNASAAVKAALAALIGEEEKCEDPADAPPPADGEEEEQKAPTALDASALDASKGAMAIAMDALKEVHRMRAEAERAKENQERMSLIESRPDFSPTMRKMLASAPLSTVRDFCQNLEKLPNFAEKVAASVGAQATVQGDSEPGSAMMMDPAEKARMDRIMGLAKRKKLGTRMEGNKLVFGVEVD